MPKKFKGENSKVTAANERKAATAAQKDASARAIREAKEAEEWAIGAKVNKRLEEQAKRSERIAKKAAAAALLEEEEAKISRKRGTNISLVPHREAPRTPTVIKGTAKVAPRREQAPEDMIIDSQQDVPEYSASGLDAALELLSVSKVTSNSSSVYSSVMGRPLREIDRHPERRAKAAWLAYRDRELDQVKQENPGLRLSQLNELLWKKWQKSPENPFNQTTLAYNATSDQERKLVENKNQAALERMRIN